MDPVDQQRDEIEAGQIRAEQLAERLLRRGHEPAAHRRFRRGGRGRLDRLADGFEAGAVAAGRQLGQHPLHRQAAQDLGGGEQLIGRHRHLLGAVRAAHPGAAHRHPPAAQGHRAVLAAVTHRCPLRVVAALRPADPGHVRFHHRRHHLHPGRHGEGQQALLNGAGDLGQLHDQLLGRGGHLAGRLGLIVLGHRWWSPCLAGRVLGRTPDTYQPAGPERGTATSTSTTTGTTSGRALSTEAALWAARTPTVAFGAFPLNRGVLMGRWGSSGDRAIYPMRQLHERIGSALVGLPDRFAGVASDGLSVVEEQLGLDPHECSGQWCAGRRIQFDVDVVPAVVDLSGNALDERLDEGRHRLAGHELICCGVAWFGHASTVWRG